MDIKILDGGFGSQLSTHVGAKIDGDPLWTARFLATNPNAVYDTHLDFLRAEEAIKLLHKAVHLAKAAVNDYTKEIKDNVENRHTMIAGSCGPYGASLHDGSEYNGAYALETIPCYQEAEALIELLKEYPNVKAWLSFSCEKGTQNIVDGSNFQEVVLHCYRKALPGQIIAVGVNCIAPKDVTPLLRNVNMGSANEFIPLIAYPNSGEIYSPTEGWIKNESCAPFESFIPEWLELGVRYLGGCCRMYAENICYGLWNMCIP
ncbi:hypothetical protein QLX08_004052 [Tetragonisca angustula]|uniref:Hcy-binding domain-containing protein n=1 Tax=Tetragonisca angustula TaxID=166442 RepID=A0AAW1A421_9HYME